MAARDETLELATYLSNLTYDDLPEEVIHRAKASILNALGCALGAVNDGPSLKAYVALVRVDGASLPEECSIPGRQKRVDLNTAAFLNGVAISTKDFDDTHLRTVVHPSGTPLAAILPWAEKYHASGKDLILAFVVGVEAQLAVANAISPSHYKDGW
jgi:aconitate decarboxylase